MRVTREVQEGIIDSYSQHPSHTYITTGAYTVTLTVTDNDGDANSHSLSIEVDKKKMRRCGKGYAWCKLIV